MTENTEASNDANRWFVYIIEADDGSWYTGVTTDVERRFAEHVSGARGARYFRGRQPETIVFIEGSHNHVSACQREAQIKKLSRAQKQVLVDTEI